MVSTGAIGPSARDYANKIMAESNLAIVMIDRNDVERIAENASFIIHILNREAKHAMQLKKRPMKEIYYSTAFGKILYKAVQII